MTDDHCLKKTNTKNGKKIDFNGKIEFLHVFLIFIRAKKMDKMDTVKAFFFMNVFTTYITKMSEVLKPIHQFL